MYMAPEVLSSKQNSVTAAADLWSLVALFTLRSREATGRSRSKSRLDQVAAKVVSGAHDQ